MQSPSEFTFYEGVFLFTCNEEINDNDLSLDIKQINDIICFAAFDNLDSYYHLTPKDPFDLDSIINILYNEIGDLIQIDSGQLIFDKILNHYYTQIRFYTQVSIATLISEKNKERRKKFTELVCYLVNLRYRSFENERTDRGRFAPDFVYRTCSNPISNFSSSIAFNEQMNAATPDAFISPSFLPLELLNETLCKSKFGSSSQPLLKTQLRPYQLRAIRWLLFREMGREVFSHRTDLSPNSSTHRSVIKSEFPTSIESTSVSQNEKLKGIEFGSLIDSKLTSRSPISPTWIPITNFVSSYSEEAVTSCKRQQENKENLILWVDLVDGFLYIKNDDIIIDANREDNKHISRGDAFDFNGGVLAEDMGLGKTLEVLSLIIASHNFNDSKHTKDIATRVVDSEIPGIDVSPSFPSTLLRKDLQKVRSQCALASKLEAFDCICHSDPPTRGGSWLGIGICAGCSRRFHGCCIGLDFTSCLVPHKNKNMNSSSYINQGEDQLEEDSDDRNSAASSFPSFQCPVCLYITGNRPLLNATLILAPKALLNQWHAEVAKHINLSPNNNNLRIITYDSDTLKHRAALFQYTNQNCGPLVVLTTPEVLAKDLISVDNIHNPSEPGRALRRIKDELGNHRFVTRANQSYTLPSPLTMVTWNRLVVDEAQQVGGAGAVAFSLSRLACSKRWFVSGTPFIGLSTRVDAAGMLLTLSMPPPISNARDPYSARLELERRHLDNLTKVKKYSFNRHASEINTKIFKKGAENLTKSLIHLESAHVPIQLRFNIDAARSDKDSWGIPSFALESFASFIGAAFWRTKVDDLRDELGLKAIYDINVGIDLTAIEVATYGQCVEDARLSAMEFVQSVDTGKMLEYGPSIVLRQVINVLSKLRLSCHHPDIKDETSKKRKGKKNSFAFNFVQSTKKKNTIDVEEDNSDNSDKEGGDSIDNKSIALQPSTGLIRVWERLMKNHKAAVEDGIRSLIVTRNGVAALQWGLNDHVQAIRTYRETLKLVEELNIRVDKTLKLHLFANLSKLEKSITDSERSQVGYSLQSDAGRLTELATQLEASIVEVDFMKMCQLNLEFNEICNETTINYAVLFKNVVGDDSEFKACVKNVEDTTIDHFNSDTAGETNEKSKRKNKRHNGWWHSLPDIFPSDSKDLKASHSLSGHESDEFLILFLRRLSYALRSLENALGGIEGLDDILGSTSLLEHAKTSSGKLFAISLMIENIWAAICRSRFTLIKMIKDILKKMITLKDKNDENNDENTSYQFNEDKKTPEFLVNDKFIFSLIMETMNCPLCARARTSTLSAHETDDNILLGMITAVPACRLCAIERQFAALGMALGVETSFLSFHNKKHTALIKRVALYLYRSADHFGSKFSLANGPVSESTLIELATKLGFDSTLALSKHIFNSVNESSESAQSVLEDLLSNNEPEDAETYALIHSKSGLLSKRLLTILAVVKSHLSISKYPVVHAHMESHMKLVERILSISEMRAFHKLISSIRSFVERKDENRMAKLRIRVIESSSDFDTIAKPSKRRFVITSTMNDPASQSETASNHNSTNNDENSQTDPTMPDPNSIAEARLFLLRSDAIKELEEQSRNIPVFHQKFTVAKWRYHSAQKLNDKQLTFNSDIGATVQQHSNITDFEGHIEKHTSDYFSDMQIHIDCPICYEPLGNKTVIFTCSHTICKHCYDKILENSIHNLSSISCPCCRVPSPASLIVVIDHEEIRKQQILREQRKQKKTNLQKDVDENQHSSPSDNQIRNEVEPITMVKLESPSDPTLQIPNSIPFGSSLSNFLGPSRKFQNLTYYPNPLGSIANKSCSSLATENFPLLNLFGSRAVTLVTLIHRIRYFNPDDKIIVLSALPDVVQFYAHILKMELPEGSLMVLSANVSSSSQSEVIKVFGNADDEHNVEPIHNNFDSMAEMEKMDITEDRIVSEEGSSEESQATFDEEQVSDDEYAPQSKRRKMLKMKLKNSQKKSHYVPSPSSKQPSTVKDIEKQKLSKEPFVLLGPQSSIGTGLTLIRANHIILLEPWLRVSEEAQAIGRVYRMGQTKECFVWRLFATNTVESKLMQLNESQRLVSAEKRITFGFTELRELLGV